MPKTENSKNVPRKDKILDEEEDKDMDEDEDEEEEDDVEVEERTKGKDAAKDTKAGNDEKPKVFKCQICDSKVPDDSTHCPVCGTKFISPDDAEGSLEVIEDLKGPSHKRKAKLKEEPIPVVLDVEDEKAILETRKADAKKRHAPAATPSKEDQKAKAKMTKRVSKEVKSPVWLNIILVILVISILLSAYFYIAVYLPSLRMKVDGNFSDWANVPKTNDGEDSTSHVNMDIWKYAIATQDDDLFLYFEVAGTMLNGTGDSNDAVNIFVDNDKNPDTGYRVRSVGAEYRIEVTGHDGDISNAKLYHFDASVRKSDYDWSAWTESGNLKAAAKSGKLETKVSMSDINIGKGDSIAILFSVKCGDAMDFSKYTLSFAGKSVRVVQGFTAPETIPANSVEASIITLTVDAAGGDNTVMGFKLHYNTPKVFQFDLKSVSIRAGSADGLELAQATMSPEGTVDLKLTPAQEIKEGAKATFFVVVSVPNVTASPIIGLALMSPADVTIEDGTVSLSDEHPADGFVRPYIGVVPARTDIDGAFGDWTVANSTNSWTDTDAAPVNWDDINIQKVAERRRGEMGMDLMVSVKGEMLAGVPVPEQWSGGNDQPLKGDDGMDTVIIYLDSNGNVSSGKIIEGIGADVAIFLEGMNGRVVSTTIKEYDSGTGQWEEARDIAPAVAGPTAVEVTLDLNEIKHLMKFTTPNDPAPMKIVYSVETWNGGTDTSGPYTVDL